LPRNLAKGSQAQKFLTDPRSNASEPVNSHAFHGTQLLSARGVTTLSVELEHFLEEEEKIGREDNISKIIYTVFQKTGTLFLL